MVQILLKDIHQKMIVWKTRVPYVEGATVVKNIDRLHVTLFNISPEEHASETIGNGFTPFSYQEISW